MTSTLQLSRGQADPIASTCLLNRLFRRYLLLPTTESTSIPLSRPHNDFCPSSINIRLEGRVVTKQDRRVLLCEHGWANQQ
jgi:hypothetical protein